MAKCGFTSLNGGLGFPENAKRSLLYDRLSEAINDGGNCAMTQMASNDPNGANHQKHTHTDANAKPH